MFGREVPVEFACEPVGLLGCEALVETSLSMGAQIISDERDRLGCGILFINEITQDLGQFQFGVAVCDEDLAPSCERLNQQKQVAFTVRVPPGIVKEARRKPEVPKERKSSSPR